MLILDEPVNGLDPAGILEFRGLVRSLVDEGRTVLLSSHLLDEVEKTCDLAAIVDDGRVVAQGTIEALTSGGERTIDIVAEPTLKAAPACSRASRRWRALSSTTGWSGRRSPTCSWTPRRTSRPRRAC